MAIENLMQHYYSIAYDEYCGTECGFLLTWSAYVWVDKVGFWEILCENTLFSRSRLVRWC